MIDEDLYRRAAGELDSDERRPRIWARACALSNNDHDEARYLYTNLRVEELLLEVTSGASDQTSVSAHADHRDTLEDLELEPVEFQADGDEGEAIESARAGLDMASIPLHVLPPDESTVQPESEPGSLKLELVADATLDLDPADVEHMNDTDSPAVSPIHGNAVEAHEAPVAQHVDDPDNSDDDSDVASADESADKREAATLFTSLRSPRTEVPGRGTQAAESDAVNDSQADRGQDVGQRPDAGGDDGAAGDFNNELAKLVDQYRAEPQLIRSRSTDQPTDPSDSLIHDSERLVDDFADTEKQADRRQESPVANAGGSGSGHRDSGVTDSAVEHTMAEPSAFPHAGQIVDDVNEYRAPLELADTRGRVEYAIYERSDAPRCAVRQGVSWVALFLTFPWLIVRGLLGTAIVYALFALTVLTGLLFTGLAWIDAGEAATLATRLATIVFVLLALGGVYLIPLLRANIWREDKLERNGYELVAYVRARSSRRAIAMLDCEE